MNGNEQPESRIRNLSLWVVQWLLAALFLWAGAVKMILPPETLATPVALPGWFIRFIGVVETLGALGLILPWLLRIKPILTPLAATGLVIVMIGATVILLVGEGGASWVFPVIVGILAAYVAFGRWCECRRTTGLRLR